MTTDESVTSSGNNANIVLPAALPVSTENGNELIAEFMGQTPEIEFCVGNVEKGTISYSPKNIGDYFSYPSEQKAECERYLKEQKEKYPDGWITKEGYTTRRFEWYKPYNLSWDILMPVIFKFKALGFETGDEDKDEVLMNEHGALWEKYWRILPIINIEIVWAYTVSCIQWYNENKPVSKR